MADKNELVLSLFALGTKRSTCFCLALVFIVWKEASPGAGKGERESPPSLLSGWKQPEKSAPEVVVALRCREGTGCGKATNDLDPGTALNGGLVFCKQDTLHTTIQHALGDCIFLRQNIFSKFTFKLTFFS